MIAVLFTVIAAPLFAFASWLAQPVTATCPHGWYVNGVPISGRTSCVLAPTGRGANECVRGGSCTFTEPQPALPVRIFCESPLVPLVRDDRRIGCGRGAPMRHARAQRVWSKGDLL